MKALEYVNKEIMISLSLSNEDLEEKSLAYNTCPDRKSYCKSGHKCCLSSSSIFGCCAFKDGVCCSSGDYCCPKGSNCDIVNKTCKKKLENIPMSPKIKAKFIEWMTTFPRTTKKVIKKKPVNLIQCPVPDEGHFCPDSSTCCSDLSGTFSCCPIKDAICCASNIFCCPKNSFCGTHGCGVYESNDTLVETIPGRKKVQVKRFKTCLSKRHACLFDTTCCATNTGDEKCCPRGGKCIGGKIFLISNYINREI